MGINRYTLTKKQIIGYYELFWNKNKTFDIQILQCDLLSLSQGHARQEKTLCGIFDGSSPSFQYSFLLSYEEQSLICQNN